VSFDCGSARLEVLRDLIDHIVGESGQSLDCRYQLVVLLNDIIEACRGDRNAGKDGWKNGGNLEGYETDRAGGHAVVVGRDR
jgi:hypothetical protein